MQWWCSATGLPWTWTWQWHPGVHLVLILFGLGWWRLGRAQRWPRRPWRWFAVAWVTLLLTLDWPIGKLGAGYLASVHTGQFLLLTLVVAPALIRGIPPEGWRGRPPPRSRRPPPVCQPAPPPPRGVWFYSFGLRPRLRVARRHRHGLLSLRRDGGTDHSGHADRVLRLADLPAV